MISKQTKYFVGYLSLSILTLAYSIQDAYMNSSSYYAFLFRLTDGVNLGIVLNFTLCCFICLSTACQRVIFGELRLIEQEHVVERLPIYIVELLLNLTTRGNNLLLNVLLVMITLFSKVMHSILKDRLEFRNMKIANDLMNLPSYDSKVVLKSYAFNIYNFWNLIFATVDFIIAKFLVYDVFQGINSVPCLLYGFQFAVEGLALLTIFVKLSLDAYELIYYPNHSGLDDEFDVDQEDIRGDDSEELVWETKGYYVKSVEIVACLLRVISYLVFIYLLGIHAASVVPLSMIQGVFSSARETYKEFKKLLSFIELSKRLDSQLADASEEDLQSDNLCTICRDDMHSIDEYERVFQKKISPRRKPKKIGCGHILHMGCLKDWLERSDNCPLCRRKVFNSPGEADNSATESNTNQTQTQEASIDSPEPNNNRPIPFQRDPLVGRFQDFDEILRRRRENNSQSENLINNIPEESNPDVFAATNLSMTDDSRYQSITLPTTATLPPNWTILPLNRTAEGNYTVHYSRVSSGTLKTECRTRSRDLVLIDPNLTPSSENSTTSNTNENNDVNCV